MNHLEDYTDILESIPTDLCHPLTQILQLDSETQSLLKSLNSSLPAKDPSQLHALDSLLSQSIKLAEEKVSLASRAWESLDRHIRRLDEDIVRFETEYNFNESECAPSEKNPEPAPSTEPTVKNGGRPVRKAADRTLKRLNDTDLEEATKEDSSPPIEQPSSTVLIQAEPVHLPSIESLPGKIVDVAGIEFPHSHPAVESNVNEPRYCYCNQVSFGEMIACDNEDCEVEWFHYECVGLVQPPKGQWYCNECVQKKKKGLIK